MSLKHRKNIKWVSVFVLVSTLSVTVFPSTAMAGFDSAVIVAAITKFFNWAQGKMMDQLQENVHEQTDKLTGKAESIFKEKTNWEKWPSSLKTIFVDQAVKLEDEGNQMAYQNAKDFLSYTQGSASGADGSKYPTAVMHDFNKRYEQVQDMGSNCELDVPKAVGDTSSNCTPAQTQFTNYLITGVNPIPDYPKSATNSSDGQAYIQEKNVSKTRLAMAQIALDQASNSKTDDFVKSMEEQLKKPSTETINNESSAAIARDTLILNKAQAMIAMRQYEATLMNQRLLATLVSQLEDQHINQMRKYTQNFR